MDLSVVIPAYNETDSVEELLGEVLAVLEPLKRPFEILFVDDGSTDGTTEKLENLSAQDDHVRLIRFVRNAGKSAAYAAAFQAVRGDVVLTLDADLQDDPAEIPKLLEQIDAGYDVVVGWKMHRFENEPRKTIPSRVFNGLAHWTFGIQLRDSNSGFRAMRRRVAQSLQLYGGMYRFIPQLAHLKGFRVTQCGVAHRKRRYGVTKYGAGRFWTGLLDLLTVRFITRFSKTPLHFLGTMGIAPFALGVLLEFYVLFQKILGDTFQTHIAAIVIGVLLMTVGFQCIVAGLLAELLSAERGGADYIVAEDGEPDHRPSGADVGTGIG
jgi:glycosyltransferase involved in cell wall biosynthesis